MKNYRTIIFDADHTLIDFNEDERRAFRAAFRGTKAASEEAVETMWKFSLENWLALGLTEVHLPEIKREYHNLYYTHVRCIFDEAERLYAIDNRAQREALFSEVLSEPSVLKEGALETVQYLAKKYTVAVATNGLSRLQHTRLQPLKPYLAAVFVSEEMGIIKPDKLFFEKMLSSLSASPEECLMVGDSLKSDVAGAGVAGIDCVWYNPQKRPLPEGYRVLFEIQSLKELIEKL